MIRVLQTDYGRTLQGVAEGRVALTEDYTRNACRWAVQQIERLSGLVDSLMREKDAAYGLKHIAEEQGEDVLLLMRDVAEVATVMKLIRPIATAGEYISIARSMAMVPIKIDQLQDIREHHEAITNAALARRAGDGQDT